MNPLKSARHQLERIAPLLSLSEAQVGLLIEPDRVIEKALSLQMDDGSQRVFQAYRSQHKNVRGPYKGGIRFHPEVTRDEVQALSIWMTWKTALLDLPLGGGKGGVVVDTKKLSSRELESLAREYARAFAPFIGAGRDVPAPDVATDPRIMGYILDEYEKIKGRSEPGVITGKPLSLGGSKARDYATAQGAFYVIEAIRHKLGLLFPIRVALQGVGNSGGPLACLLEEAGYTLVALSDSRDTLLSPEGVPVMEVLRHKETCGVLAGCAGCESQERDGVLFADADILIPAALESVITEENAHKVKANIVVEVANGPITPGGEAILEEAGVQIFPDILANAGGVTVSYFEQVQNAMNFYWTEEEILLQLKEKIEAATQAVFDTQEKFNVSYREAAYILAVERVVEAMRARGRM